MKKINILVIALLASALVSCDRQYLEPWPPDAARTLDDVLADYKYSKGMLDVIYADHMCAPCMNDIAGRGMLASATDEAEHSVSTAAVQNFTNGVWNPSKVPTVEYGAPWSYRNWRTPWQHCYIGIRLANLFLENVDRSMIINDIEDPAKRYERTWFKGQAYFWRAYLEFQLLRTYGKFVISTKSEEVSDPELFRDRNSIDECVAQIVKDCNSAIDSLPLLWTNEEWYRANKTTAQALKSRVLLYYASPLYQGDFETFGLPKNTVGDVQRWKDAAKAAREAIQDNSYYHLAPVYKYNRPYSQVGSYNQSVFLAMDEKNRENIFSTPPTQNQAMTNEIYNLPAGIDGFYGYTNPTQEMVDAFEVIDPVTHEAVPFDWNNPVHAANPYENRDPRFYASILYNDYLWGASLSKAYKIETYEGGAHRDKNLQNSTKTGYYFRKTLDERVYKNVRGFYNTPQRARIDFRFAELLLNYAEAMNEAYGPEVSDPEGALRLGISTAKEAIDMIRARVKMPALPSGLSQDEMREKIKHERRIELCFEGHRFYDVRRWKEGEIFGQPIHGVNITVASRDDQGKPNKFNYEVVQVEERIWKDCMYWWPINYSEISKYGGKMTQNPGW